MILHPLSLDRKPIHPHILRVRCPIKIMIPENSKVAEIFKKISPKTQIFFTSFKLNIWYWIHNYHPHNSFRRRAKKINSYSKRKMSHLLVIAKPSSNESRSTNCNWSKIERILLLCSLQLQNLKLFCIFLILRAKGTHFTHPLAPWYQAKSFQQFDTQNLVGMNSTPKT